MASFFRDIQNFFSAEYAGRYMSIIMREIARHEPPSFLRIMYKAAKMEGSDRILKVAGDFRKGLLEAECETPFEGSSGMRRADLALLRKGSPVALFEVKERDVRNRRNTAQLSDYVARVAEDGVVFVHLSRFMPDRLDHDLLMQARANGYPVASLRYRDVYKALEKAEGPIARMVCSYMEEIGVAGYGTLDLEKQGRAMAFALVRMLEFPHAHGLGKLASDEAVLEFPRMFKTIFDNLEFLGDTIREQNRKMIGMRFTRNFMPETYFNLRKLANALNREEPEGGTIDVLPGGSGKFVDSGLVGFYANGRIRSPQRAAKKLGPNDWFDVNIGYEFEITKGKSERLLKLYMGAGFSGRRLEEVWVHKKWDRFPNENQALRCIHDCLNRSLQRASDQSDGAFKEALRHFNLPTRP